MESGSGGDCGEIVVVVVADKKEGELEQLESMKIKLMHPAGHETRPYIY